MSEAIVGDDGLARCPWAAADGVNAAYHDTEWGLPVEGESAHLERLTLEAFQSGLSWRTILTKRPAFREVFAGFDADTIAAYDERDVERLLGESRIVRNRRKVEAAITNARATIELRDDGGLVDFLWSFKPGRTPVPVTSGDVATTSPESIALSRALKKRGFAHVGPTTMYALMEAIGIVDDHLVGCHRRGASGVWA